MKKIKSFILLLIICSNYSFAEIYKWTDADGVTHYSDIKPAETKVEEFNIITYQNVVIEKNQSYVGQSNEESNEEVKSLTRTRPKKVVMYSAEWCGVCKKAKKYFRKENIRYTDYDIDKSKSAKRRYDKLGAKGVPVILVGKQRMKGFSVGGFKKLYKN